MGKIKVSLEKSTRKDKKFMVIIEKEGGRSKKVHFGANGYSDYTKHKDPLRKNKYVSRHRNNENWTKSGIETPGFWAKHILWNQPTLKGSISNTSSKFGITIKNNASKGMSRSRSRSRSRVKRKSAPKSKKKTSQGKKRCPHGIKKDGTCKKKPGPKRSSNTK